MWLITIVQDGVEVEFTETTRDRARAFRAWTLTLPEVTSAVVRKKVAA